MSKSRFKETSVASLALLLTVATAKPAASLNVPPIIAQSPALQMPTNVPSGTTVDIDGSRSVIVTNQTFKQQFETQFPNTAVQLNYRGNEAALQSLRNGEIDIAAIGRPLTDAEKAEGLVLDPLSRPKVAIVVGKKNPFEDSLTAEQFAKIFRGEITNWAEVGGAAGSIRLIDRPDTSDTRQAFQTYPVFQQAPFATGATARKLTEDSTEAMVRELGKDGIGYAIADQVTNQSGIRIVPMHDTLPSDARYPFSQPLSYVYQGPEPNADVRAFLGYITAPKGQVAAAMVPPTIAASPETVVAPAVSPPNSKLQPAERFSAWWLALPVLGGLLWWLLKRSSSARVASPIASPVVAAAAVPDSQIILVPQTCKTAYAYWEVPEATEARLLQQGGETLTLRIYDVTNIDLDTQSAHSVEQYECDGRSPDYHLSIPSDNRDYIAELGYLTADNRWLKVARSTHVRVPACPVSNNIPPTILHTVPSDISSTVKKDTVRTAKPIEETVKPLGIAVTTAAAGNVIQSGINQSPARESRIILTPRNANDLYAYWEVTEDHKAELKQQGGQNMTLRLYDETDDNTLDPQSTRTFQEYKCSEQDSDIHILIPEPNRGYVAELGYVTTTGHWLKLARSPSVQVPIFNQEVTSVASTKSSDVVSAVASSISETSVVKIPRATVQYYGDFTPGDAATVQYYGDFTPSDAADVQRYGDFTPSDTVTIQYYGDFTPGDTATVQHYGKSSGQQALGDSVTNKFNTVTMSLPIGQSLRSSGYAVSDRTGQSSRIILVPRSSKSAYVYWEVSSADREAAKQQGGIQLTLRVYEVTNIDMDDIPAHSVQQFECDEQQQDRSVAIPVGDRDYVAEIGYTTAEGRWLSIIRSLHVRVLAI